MNVGKSIIMKVITPENDITADVGAESGTIPYRSMVLAQFLI
ncbi:MAG: hypothetical protein QW161_04185 [Candidatus Bathyarchaeia archaeon]